MKKMIVIIKIRKKFIEMNQKISNRMKIFHIKEIHNNREEE
jgi:hypothetical protein